MKYTRKGKGRPLHYSAPLLNDLVEILAFMFYFISFLSSYYTSSLVMFSSYDRYSFYPHMSGVKILMEFYYLLQLRFKI